MKKYFYIFVIIIMALFTGFIAGVGIGMNVSKIYIDTGDKYQYYNQEIDPGMELNPWES